MWKNLAAWVVLGAPLLFSQPQLGSGSDVDSNSVFDDLLVESQLAAADAEGGEAETPASFSQTETAEAAELEEADRLRDAYDQDDRRQRHLRHGHRHHRNHQVHHRRHHRHHGHRGRHHKRATLFEVAPASTSSGAAHVDEKEEEPPADKQALKASLENEDHEQLPGRVSPLHPAVAEKVGVMSSELRDLRGLKKKSQEARGALEGEVASAVLNMNEAVGIQRKLREKEVHYHALQKKEQKLKDDISRLDRTHKQLLSSLHGIMDPKVNFADDRLASKQREVRELQSNEEHWAKKSQTLKADSLAALESRKQAKARVQAAEDAIAKAQREHSDAEKALGHAKDEVQYDIEKYRYAKTHHEGAQGQLKHGKEAVEAAEGSVKRLNGIVSMEQRRVDHSLSVSKDHLQSKIREVEGLESQSKSELDRLASEFTSWQDRQRKLDRRVADAKQVTSQASNDFAEHQATVLRNAQEKVAREAERGADWAWDVWPGAQGGRQDDEDDVGEISISN